MTLTHTGKHPNFINIAKQFDYLNHFEVAVGFFGENDALLLTIVRANEYGADIKPKKGDYLYVPYKKANDKQGFYKLKEVHIPARPFIENAWKANEEKYKKMVLDGLTDIANGKITGRGLLNKIGSECVSDIRDAAIDLKNPPNAPLTIANKGSENPLVDTGELERKVTYKIIKA